MTDRPPASDEATSSRMRRVRRRDTAAELALRRELHRRGLRFRVEYAVPGLPRRRADVAFTRDRLAVFVDGCFWHGCPIHATAPKSNAEWWREKLQRNIERDRDTDRTLALNEWHVQRFWEHDDPVGAAEAVHRLLRCMRESGD